MKYKSFKDVTESYITYNRSPSKAIYCIPSKSTSCIGSTSCTGLTSWNATEIFQNDEGRV